MNPLERMRCRARPTRPGIRFFLRGFFARRDSTRAPHAFAPFRSGPPRRRRLQHASLGRCLRHIAARPSLSEQSHSLRRGLHPSRRRHSRHRAERPIRSRCAAARSPAPVRPRRFRAHTPLRRSCPVAAGEPTAGVSAAALMALPYDKGGCASSRLGLSVGQFPDVQGARHGAWAEPFHTGCGLARQKKSFEKRIIG